MKGIKKFANKQAKTVQKFVQEQSIASSESAQLLKDVAQELGLQKNGNLITMNCPGVVNPYQSEAIDLGWFEGSGVAADKTHRYNEAGKAVAAYRAAVNDNNGDLKQIYYSMDVYGRVMFHYLVNMPTITRPDNLNLNDLNLFYKVNQFMIDNYSIGLDPNKVAILNHYISWNAGQAEGVYGVNFLKVANNNVWEPKINALGGKVPGNSEAEARQKAEAEAKLKQESEAEALAEQQKAEAKLKQENDAKALAGKQRDAEEKELNELRNLKKETELAIAKIAKEQAEKTLGFAIDAEIATKILTEASSKLESVIIGMLGFGGADKDFYEQRVSITQKYLPGILDTLYNKYISEVQAEQEATMAKEITAMESSLAKTTIEDKTKTAKLSLNAEQVELLKNMLGNQLLEKGVAKAAVHLIIANNDPGYSKGVFSTDFNKYADNPKMIEIAERVCGIIKNTDSGNFLAFNIDKAVPDSFKDLTTMELDKATPKTSEQKPYKLTEQQIDFANKMLDYVNGDPAAALRAILKDNMGGGNGGEHNTFNDQAYLAFNNSSINDDVEIAAAIYVSTVDHLC